MKINKGKLAVRILKLEVISALAFIYAGVFIYAIVK